MNLIVLLEFRQNDLEQCADWNLIGQCVNREFVKNALEEIVADEKKKVIKFKITMSEMHDY